MAGEHRAVSAQPTLSETNKGPGYRATLSSGFEVKGSSQIGFFVPNKEDLEYCEWNGIVGASYYSIPFTPKVELFYSILFMVRSHSKYSIPFKIFRILHTIELSVGGRVAPRKRLDGGLTSRAVPRLPMAPCAPRLPREAPGSLSMPHMHEARMCWPSNPLTIIYCT